MSKYTPVLELPGKSKVYLPGSNNLKKACKERNIAWKEYSSKSLSTMVNNILYNQRTGEKTNDKEK